MPTGDSPAETDSLNWLAVGALYAGLALGLVWLLYGGDYRNATWLGLIGLGGGCSAYGRVLAARGHDVAARWSNRAGALFYAAFFLWAGAVLVQSL
jgi:hypothetical protein